MIVDLLGCHYVVEVDEQGDEILSLDESSAWPLPPEYRQREVALAAENMELGHYPADMAISRNTLFEGVQILRASYDDPPWGDKFKKDPRPFSSPRKEQTDK